MGGATDGTTLAPNLAGVPRLLGNADYITKVLLHGMTGELDGKNFPGGGVMVPMGTNTDDWIADVASYVRNSFGNAAAFVTPERVAAVRKANPRTSMWSFAELVSTTPMPLLEPGPMEGDGEPQPGGGRQRHQRRGHDAVGKRGRADAGHVVPDRAAAAGERRRDPGRHPGRRPWRLRLWPRPRGAPGWSARVLQRPGVDGRRGVERTRGRRAGAEPDDNDHDQAGAGAVRAHYADGHTADGGTMGGPARANLQRRDRQRIEALTAMALQSINPATGETLATFDTLAPAEVMVRLERATAAFRAWKDTPFSERARLLMRAAGILETESETLGRLMTLEMGKPVRAGIDEALKCARGCRYYAEHAARFLADEDVRTEAKASYIRYEPLGVVLAVMPWNFPFWQVFRFAAPALMAGNVGLLKHASNVPQCAAGHRGHLPARRFSRRRVPDAPDSVGGRGAAPR